MSQTLLYIAIMQLMADPNQPRKSFPQEEIERLAASIKARGILQPLRVKKDDARQCWQILIGECRWRAAMLAGLETVPCIEVDGEVSETDVLIDQIVENSARHSLRPLELARSIAKLKALLGSTSQTLAKELGLSSAGITRAEALLTLPPDIQTMVDDGRLAESAAYEISRLPDEIAQRSLALAAEGGKLNRERIVEAVRGTVPKRNIVPRSSRVTARLDGLSITVSGAEPLTWDGLLAGLDRLRKEAKKLYEGGREINDLARSLRAS